MDAPSVKQEVTATLSPTEPSGGLSRPGRAVHVINLSDSDSSSGSGSDSDDGAPSKKRKPNFIVPEGFLAPLLLPPPPPLPADDARPLPLPAPPSAQLSSGKPSSKQFWKAGDYDGGNSGDWGVNSGGIDHVRVHPKFLHSNATSHKWALGAFAELLDNSLDEIPSGATYVNIDMLENKKDRTRMLLIEDDGGGMDPDKMRQCMSLGYSAKSKVANTIGQYGNGFKTSTMRLGADVIVFSRCPGKDGKSPTQSIGLLSYTFLRSTGMEDIIVPMLDYERRIGGWNSMQRSSSSSWNRNVETITQWSPFSSEADLLRQFSMMKDHGTRIIIYNLWEDDRGLLELDFDADNHDIQLGGVNRDEKNIKMAQRFPNSRHFLTYRHSLRSYASILYLRVPSSFRIILRGRDVQHHNIVNDMMMSQEVTYRPQPNADGIPRDDMAAVVTIGFVKDAMHHIDVQGFNVYHKNRLIKPFWRLWNPAGSGGRGVIGVLEANFVEPAHDKQGFERTTVLARLEGKLVQMQKSYWKTNCHKIGYVSNNQTPKPIRSASKSAGHLQSNASSPPQSSDKYSSRSSRRTAPPSSSSRPALSSSEDDPSEDERPTPRPKRNLNSTSDKIHKTFSNEKSGNARASFGDTNGNVSPAADRMEEPAAVSHPETDDSEITQLKLENKKLRDRLERTEDVTAAGLQTEIETERKKSKTLELQLEEAKEKIDQLTKEQDTLCEIFAEERERRDNEEQTLRNKLKEASTMIQSLVDKVKLYEKRK